MTNTVLLFEYECNFKLFSFSLLHEDEQRALIKQLEDVKRGMLLSSYLFSKCQSVLIQCSAQEHMILRLKKMEWECERTLMERVSVIFIVVVNQQCCYT